MTGGGPVLVVGGTGNVGGQVVAELLRRGGQVRCLVRPSTDAAGLSDRGVEIVRGDMLDVDSLVRAMAGVDAVVTSAAGYTRGRADAVEVDTVGQANLVAAASRTGVRRFVFTSILTCDQTPQVPHFWHKKLAEDRLETLGVPFVSLRPGAFLDQMVRRSGDPFAARRLTWIGDPNVALTFVLTSDLAEYLVDAVDAPGVEGQRIDIGWDRPVSMLDIAEIASRLLGEQIHVQALPAGFAAGPPGAQGGRVPQMPADMAAMLDWFGTGRYVADTARQDQVFGPAPTAEDAIARFATSLGHAIKG